MTTLTNNELAEIEAGSFANDLGWAIGTVAGFVADAAMAAYGKNPVPLADRVGII